MHELAIQPGELARTTANHRFLYLSFQPPECDDGGDLAIVAATATALLPASCLLVVPIQQK